MRIPKLAFLVLCLVALGAFAQSASDTDTKKKLDEARGITSYVGFAGDSDALGQIFKLNFSLGYDLNRHFGVDAGVPVYIVRSSATSTTSAATNSGIGDPYVDLLLRAGARDLRYRSALTVFIPAANTSTGFGAGQARVIWNNHLERSFSRLTPFVNLGIGNTIPDYRFFRRPFTSVGFAGSVEGGAEVDLGKIFSVGGSGYAVLPSGNQTVFNRFGASAMSAGRGRRPFEGPQKTTGTADLTRDQGASAWLSADVSRYVRLGLGFTRSFYYDLNDVSFGIGLNVGRMIRDHRK